MRFTKFMITGAVIASATASLPAAAAPILFELSGSRSAVFTIDPVATTPDFFNQSFIGDQVSFNKVAGTFGGVAGVGDIGFGTFLAATLNIGNPNLGFTQFTGPDLFSVIDARPVFNIGTFNLTSIVSGASTLRISAASVAAVPEPLSWGLMTLGFGVAGAMLRYRRRSTKAAVQFV